jgi:hypothetical protein
MLWCAPSSLSRLLNSTLNNTTCSQQCTRRAWRQGRPVRQVERQSLPASEPGGRRRRNVDISCTPPRRAGQNAPCQGWEATCPSRGCWMQNDMQAWLPCCSVPRGTRTHWLQARTHPGLRAVPQVSGTRHLCVHTHARAAQARVQMRPEIRVLRYTARMPYSPSWLVQSAHCLCHLLPLLAGMPVSLLEQRQVVPILHIHPVAHLSFMRRPNLCGLMWIIVQLL